MTHDEQTCNSAKFFSHEWEVYMKVVENNYMCHREIYASLKDFINQRHGKSPLSVLELGCGDASQTAKALADSQVERYIGYDLSAAALAEANWNLSQLQGQVALIGGDLLEGIANAEPGFDVVLVSFALHHLQTGGKRDFFHHASRVLKRDGVLLLVDVMREEMQTQEEYLGVYLTEVAQHWLALNTEEINSIRTHVAENDLPETASWHAMAAKEAGFSSASKLAHHTWHQAWYFEKTSSR